MAAASLRELRTRSDELIDRAARGERITITRFGKPVAELRAVSRTPMSVEELLARHRLLPAIDAPTLRSDIDRVLDPSVAPTP